MLWSGTIESIPDGWHLCDGTHGTPDMRDQFSLSAGPLFPRGTSADYANHPHPFTGDGHRQFIPTGTYIETIPDDYEKFLPPTSAAGTTDFTEPLPPYYSLAYVMRLPD